MLPFLQRLDPGCLLYPPLSLKTVPYGRSVLSTVEQGLLWEDRDTGRVAKIVLVKDTLAGSAEVTTATPRPRSPKPVHSLWR